MGPEGGGDALLRLEGVSKRYRRSGLLALDDVSIWVGAGERVGLMGPSGSGKSTLACIAAGLLSPNAGHVRFDGVERSGGGRLPRGRSAAVRRAWLGMQMVFQDPEASFIPTMRLGDAVFEGARYLPRFKGADKDRLVREALEAVELPGSYAERFPYELSGGECQRAAIARAVIGRPKLLLCDEATSALDVTVQAKVMALLGRVHRELGTAFLFIGHNPALVGGFCDRIYRIGGGRITEELEACERA